MLKRIASALFTLAIPFAPSLARACPVCFAASGARAYRAYYLSTMLLSVMPFVLIGLVIGAAYMMRNRGDTPSGG